MARVSARSTWSSVPPRCSRGLCGSVIYGVSVASLAFPVRPRCGRACFSLRPPRSPPGGRVHRGGSLACRVVRSWAVAPRPVLVLVTLVGSLFRLAFGVSGASWPVYSSFHFECWTVCLVVSSFGGFTVRVRVWFHCACYRVRGLRACGFVRCGCVRVRGFRLRCGRSLGGCPLFVVSAGLPRCFPALGRWAADAVCLGAFDQVDLVGASVRVFPVPLAASLGPCLGSAPVLVVPGPWVG